jgi:hypothetical protein
MFTMPCSHKHVTGRQPPSTEIYLTCCFRPLLQANTASTAQTADGNAMALAGSLALGGINSASRANSVAQSGTADARARADAVGIGSLHGEAKSSAVSATGGCPRGTGFSGSLRGPSSLGGDAIVTSSTYHLN